MYMYAELQDGVQNKCPYGDNKVYRIVSVNPLSKYRAESQIKCTLSMFSLTDCAVMLNVCLCFMYLCLDICLLMLDMELL